MLLKVIFEEISKGLVLLSESELYEINAVAAEGTRSLSTSENET